MIVPEHRSSDIGRRIIRGAAVILFFGLFLRLGGVLMNTLLSQYYGKGPVLDAYVAVYKTAILLLFYSSMLKVLIPAFMPLFAEQRHDKDESAAWDLANTITNLTLLTAVACAAAAFFFAPQLVGMLFPEFSQDARGAAVGLLRWMAPGILIQFFAIMGLGVLNSYKIFSYPSAAEAAQKLVWAAGIFAAFSVLKLPRTAESAPAVIGATYLLGCAVQAAVLAAGLGWERMKLYRFSLPLLSLRRCAIEAGWVAIWAALFAGWAWLMNWLAADPQRVPFGLSFDGNRCAFFTLTGLIVAGCGYSAVLWHRGRRGSTLMARMAVLCAPLIVGVIFARYRDLSRTFFQSYLTKGDFSIIGFANNVAALPGMLVASSLAIAMLPYLSDKAAQKDATHHGAVVGGSVRMMAVTLLPLTALLIFVSAPIMRLLFDKGDWQPGDIATARLALAILSTGVFFMAIENILMQAFFSLQQTMFPTALGIIISAGSSLGLYALIEGMGIKANEANVLLLVCLSYPVPVAVKNLLLLHFVNRRERLMSAEAAWSFVTRLALICLSVAVAAWAAHAGAVHLLHQTTGKLSRVKLIAEIAVPSIAALVVYLALMALLRMEELRLTIDYIRRRGWKLRAGAAGGGNGEA